MAKKINYKKIIPIAVMTVTFVFIFYFVQKNRLLIFKDLKGNIRYLVFIALAYIIGRIFEGLRLKIMANAFSLNLKRWEWIGLSFVVPYYNLILPKGGTIANAAYFNIKHKFAFEKFVAFTSGGLLLTFLVNGFFGIMAVSICIMSAGKISNLWFLSLFIPMFIGAAILMCIPHIKLFDNHRLLSKINSILDGWEKLRSDRTALLRLIIVQIAILSSFALRYYFAFKIFTSGVSYWSVFASSSVTYIANILSIIPGNLGFREFVVTMGAHFIGESIKKGAMVSIIDRIVITVVTCVLGAYYNIRLMKSVDTLEKEVIAEKVMVTHD